MSEDKEIINRHEEIIRQRAELLEQMTVRRNQLIIQKEQQLKKREAARSRNTSLLQDLQKIEDCIRRRQMPHPNLLAMETRFWVSVEEALPSWEPFLLGKGPHPSDSPGHPPRRDRRTSSNTVDQRPPPHPKPSTSR
ncbi:uncharacterized protein C3orf14 homolog isoform X2 [Kryptolebias marmoratus]|uniref:Uncharacterized protein n=1 Tax=Kryptolebias marmoratus TaxID=37003 RepID=A0A3Q3ADU2_KRYMA|nr:uncharacterized protein C3orf14 homolog isoform X2 [Kryptolebias marmoratus]